MIKVSKFLYLLVSINLTAQELVKPALDDVLNGVSDKDVSELVEVKNNSMFVPSMDSYQMELLPKEIDKSQFTPVEIDKKESIQKAILSAPFNFILACLAHAYFHELGHYNAALSEDVTGNKLEVGLFKGMTTYGPRYNYLNDDQKTHLAVAGMSASEDIYKAIDKMVDAYAHTTRDQGQELPIPPVVAIFQLLQGADFSMYVNRNNLSSHPAYGDDIEQIKKFGDISENEMIAAILFDGIAKASRTKYYLKSALGIPSKYPDRSFQVGKIKVHYDYGARPWYSPWNKHTSIYYYLEFYGSFGGSISFSHLQDQFNLKSLEFEFMRLNYLANPSNWSHVKELPYGAKDIQEAREIIRNKLIRLVRQNPEFLDKAKSISEAEVSTIL